MSLILITHDLGVVAQMCSRVAVMCGGYVVEEEDVRDIFHHPAHPYTQALIASMPRAGSSTLELFLEKSISGEKNEDLCPFCDRCRHVQKLCRQKIPDMCQLKGRHKVFCHLGEEVRNG